MTSTATPSSARRRPSSQAPVHARCARSAAAWVPSRSPCDQQQLRLAEALLGVRARGSRSGSAGRRPRSARPPPSRSRGWLRCSACGAGARDDELPRLEGRPEVVGERDAVAGGDRLQGLAAGRGPSGRRPAAARPPAKSHARRASRIPRGSAQSPASASVRAYEARAASRASSSPASPGVTTQRAEQVRHARAGRLLEQVEQAAPAGRAVHGLGVCRAGGGLDRRLVRAPPIGGGGPGGREPLGAQPLGELARELVRRRVAIGLLGGPGAGGRPGVQRDRRQAQGLRELRRRGLDLELAGRALRVPGGEPLGRPAVRDERPVEPRVGRLVERDGVARPVRDLDPVRGGVEQPGVRAGLAADRLLDDQRLVVRPRQADVRAEDRAAPGPAAPRSASPSGGRPSTPAGRAGPRPSPTATDRCWSLYTAGCCPDTKAKNESGLSSGPVREQRAAVGRLASAAGTTPTRPRRPSPAGTGRSPSSRTCRRTRTPRPAA